MLRNLFAVFASLRETKKLEIEKQKGGEIPAHPLLVLRAVFLGQTIVTEKSRLLSAIAPIKLASFCMFHSFNLPHSPLVGRVVAYEGILYVLVVPPR